jgi:hypothetical protein
MECLRAPSILVAKKQVEMPRPAALALLLFTACARRPEDSLFYQETWEAFVLAPSGVIEVAGRVSNRGLRRGLASMQARTVRSDGVMELLSEGPTSTFEVAEDHGGLRLAGGSIGDDGIGTGNWRVIGSELSIIALTIQNRLGLAAPHAAWIDRGGAFRIEVPIAEGRAIGTTWAHSNVMSGSAVVVHRGGDALPWTPRRFLWAIGPGISVGYDGEGRSHAAWIVREGATVEAEDAAITAWTEDEIILEIPGQRMVATFRPESPRAPEPIEWNSLRAERFLLSLAGIPTTRDLRASDATISFDGADGMPARGLVLEER